MNCQFPERDPLLPEPPEAPPPHAAISTVIASTNNNPALFNPRILLRLPQTALASFVLAIA